MKAEGNKDGADENERKDEIVYESILGCSGVW